MTSRSYYISTGEKQCFYTLRYRFTDQTLHGAFVRDYHVCNLSTDPQEAIAKAKERVGEGGGNFSADFSLNAIERRTEIDWSIFQSGAKAGRSVHEVLEKDRDYLVWACEALAENPRYAKTLELARVLVGDELSERKVRLDQEADRKERISRAVQALLSPWAAKLQDGKGGFRDSIASDFRRGILPSGNALNISGDILARVDGGRSGSTKFDTALAAFNAVVAQAREVPRLVELQARYEPWLNTCDRMGDSLIAGAAEAGLDPAIINDAVDGLTAACSEIRSHLEAVRDPAGSLPAAFVFAAEVRQHLLLGTAPEWYEPVLAAADKAARLAGEDWVLDFADVMKETRIARSYLCEVCVAGEWSTNGLRFASLEEADDYGNDLLSRWTGPTHHRCRARGEEPTARFHLGQVDLLPAHPATQVLVQPDPRVAREARLRLLSCAEDFAALWDDAGTDRARLALEAALKACGAETESDVLLRAVAVALAGPSSPEALRRLRGPIARERAITRLEAFLEEHPKDLAAVLRRLGHETPVADELGRIRALVDVFFKLDAQTPVVFTQAYIAAPVPRIGSGP